MSGKDKDLQNVHRRSELPGLDKAFLNVRNRRDEGLKALGLVLRATEAAFKIKSAEELWKDLVTIIIEETAFENASLLLYNSKENSLDLGAALDIYQHMEGEDREYNRDLRFYPGEWVAWRVFESHAPVFVEDTSKEPIPEVPNAKINPKSLVSLPLMGQGVLNLSSSSPKTFEPCQRRDLIIVANVIGHLIQESQIRSRLTMSHQHLQQLVEAKTTELNRANKELRSTIGYMEYVIQNAPQGICLLDPDGLIRHANQSFLTMFDVSIGELSGFSPEAIFKERGDYASLRAALEQSGVAQAYDVPLIRSDGTVIPADVFLHTIKSIDGGIQGQMLVIHDLREQKAITERFIHTEKLRALGTMAGGIAHDFNNLLTTILGNVELLTRDCQDPEVLKRLKSIETAVNDGAHTVRRLQTFTAFGARQNTEDAWCYPNDAIHEIIELTRPRWKDEQQKKGITINIETDLSQTPPVAIHESDLREVLTNLIFNSIDAMPEGGTILFTTSTRDDMVAIEVSDSGFGIDQDVRHRIFDPFFTTKGIGSSGLGLSVSYGLIVAAGGTLKVDSQPGKGTTFLIELPIARDEASALPTDSQAGSHPERLKIMVVDDDEQIVDLLSTMLRSQGHHVIGFTNGKQAIHHLRNHPFDLILTDLGMPEISGLEIAAEAKRLDKPPAVALLTGWGAEYEQKDMRDQGIDAVLSKPFKFTELTRLISSLTGN